jgi:hypothetical protein
LFAVSYREVAVNLRGQVVRQGSEAAVSMRGKMDGQEVNNAAPQIKIEWRVNAKGRCRV